MTAPLSPHPPRIVWLICLGLVATTIALPFARRDGLLGWLSLVVPAGVGVILWAVLAIGAARALVAWRRDKPLESEDPRVGECYSEHVYEISWDHDLFSVRTHSGELVVQVPLPNMLDVIDVDALLLEENVTVSTPTEYVAFPKSRSARFKIAQLIGDLAGSCLEVQRGIERRRVKLTRQFATWLPVSLLAAAILVLPIAVLPEPQHLNLLWAVAGIGYGLAWWWVFWRFAYSVACFFGARKLRSMLRQEPKSGRTIRRTGAAKAGGLEIDNQSSPPRDR